MRRTPEQCPFRKCVASGGATRIFCCDLARQIVGVDGHGPYRVSREACEVCSRLMRPSPGNLNSVVASLVYGATAEILRQGDCSRLHLQEAARAQEHVRDALEFAPAGSPGEPVLHPATSPASGMDVSAPPTQPRRLGGPLAWAVGLVTAPRSEPTIGRTLDSLRAAGFESLHIFAEPGSPIPDEFRGLPVTVHGRSLGNLGNFFTSFFALYMMNPRAEAYALFQDDIRAARGLRQWCDREFWPEHTGLVSFFTSRVYSADTVGWRVLRLGFFRTYGAQAFAFRRDVLEQFLTDGRSLQFRKTRDDGDDAVVGEWATRAGIGIAYHTPSLVQHVGTAAAIARVGHGLGRASVAEAVDSVDRIPAWRPPPPAPGKIGLVGWNTATGLGYLNRDMAAHLPIEKWLVPKHREYPTLRNPHVDCPIRRVPVDLDYRTLSAWLKGLDWVLFAELPYIDRLAQYAREQEISVACLPNWEYTNLKLDWVNYVDLMICPTNYTYELLVNWKRRFGFAWDVIRVPWPIDTARFRFRRREICRRFLFVNGTGGTPALRPDGSLTEYRRKGIEVLFEAAGKIPQIPILVYSQVDQMPRLPANVELRRAPARNERLYEQGDVCVQPSHWEGIGLQLLECQAAGMPLVTTDAPPMNEYQPLRTIPVTATELVSVLGNHPLTSNHLDPADLARILEDLYEADIAEASENARSYVVREHCWDKAGRVLRQAMRR